MSHYIPGLKRLPRFPYPIESTFYSPYHLDGFNNEEREEMTSSNLKRVEIIEQNSSIFYSDSLVKDYKEIFGDVKDMGTIGTIARYFGFELSKTNYFNRHLNILQIGSGPWEFYENGPKLHKKLESLGAMVTSMDINDYSNYYPEGKFVKGSWLDIDSIFKKNSFDVIFTDQMNPDLSDQIYNFYPKHLSESEKYKDLVKKSLSITTKGMLIIGGIDSSCFKIPENANDLICYNNNIQYLYLTSKHCFGNVQIYTQF